MRVRGSEFSAPIPGYKNKVLIRLGTTDVAAFEHVFINQEYGFDLKQPPSVIVDAGANAGMSAVYFAQRYPSATIFAIEPEPTSFEILRKNAKLYSQIVPLNLALWNHNDGVVIQDGGAGHWGMRVANSGAAKIIPSLTPADFIERHGITRVGLLKIDVEGAECEIFEDAANWIGRVDMICAELHDRFRAGCSVAFQSATTDFPFKWRRGELHCAAREPYE